MPIVTKAFDSGPMSITILISGPNNPKDEDVIKVLENAIEGLQSTLIDIKVSRENK